MMRLRSTTISDEPQTPNDGCFPVVLWRQGVSKNITLHFLTTYYELRETLVWHYGAVDELQYRDEHIGDWCAVETSDDWVKFVTDFEERRLACPSLQMELMITNESDCEPLPNLSTQALPRPEAFSVEESITYEGPPFRWTRRGMLGCGSKAEVYLGQKEDGEYLAAKKLQFGNQRVMDTIASEIELLSSLDHPHVIKYYGCKYYEEKGIVYIFLQYMARGTLSDYIECSGGGLTENTVKAFSTHIMKGVKYLHSKGVVHRDIKSANVLIDENGVLKLSDFDVSKGLEGLSKSRGCHTLVGSPYWMAPEVCIGEPYGVKADIWSVGCVVIEMLTGQLPWPQFDNFVDAVTVIGACTGPPPTLPKNLPAALDSFVRCCLESNPDERPSAEDVLRHPFLNM
jgi:hypothetical protein|eukprot:CAMPEP_0174284794 /NCGR_PEP_ID=MMETSP0809-20121228/6823_1 /TAXON_ID=73025 ORGANISM="Eutreptiella gymnastica-like, Strain CCMP1594" /NCGR_SAMPLE_ID=MMETSP0809 /ASSEMBLY_ACC=CAM_ASM_000658 /LENGTH=398 /DNA_ID=CAMNT_0015380431 /DNA_START=18 /DNA_END=1214 /DNA_ORIENTATION=+